MTAPAFQPLSLTGAAALTAVGANVEQTCASIRAGLAGLARHAFYEAVARAPEWEDDEALAAAPVRTLDPALPGPERLLSLLVPVITELVTGARLLRRDLEGCALLLALPGRDAATDAWGLDDELAPELCRRLGLAPPVTRTTRSGHAGMLELCADASALFASREVDACIVAGVDTYLTRERLELYDHGYRIKSRRNVDGFCPGEAATAVLVETPRRVRSRSAEVRATLAGLGVGTEPRTVRSEEHSSAAGLTTALRSVLPPRAGAEAAWVICDLNGESYRAFEWGAVRARLGARIGDVAPLVHPATSVGDVGAATGGLLLAQAMQAFRRGYAPRDEALVWSSSEAGLRAAARVARSGTGEG